MQFLSGIYKHELNAKVDIFKCLAGPSFQFKLNYLYTLSYRSWFHGKISREQAEQLLQPRVDGLFLVRESTNFPGDYTLCVCFQNKVEHYRVKYHDRRLTIDDEEYFDNLESLIDHYKNDADGLCTKLITCLPKDAAKNKETVQNTHDNDLFVISEQELDVSINDHINTYFYSYQV